MKNFFLFLILIGCLSTVKAQDFKIKKGSIQVDNTTIANIKKDKKQYILSDPSGALLYQAEFKSITPKGRTTSQRWIELVNKDNKINEISPKLAGFTLNMEKRLVENLFENNFLTATGVNPAKYDNEDVSITNELDRILDDFEQKYAFEDKIAEEAKLKLNKAKDDFYPITVDFILVGYLTGESRPDPRSKDEFISEYLIYNTNKEPIAKLVFNSTDTGNELKPKYIKTYNDNKQHPIIVKCRFLLADQEPMANRMVKVIFANGYLPLVHK